MNFDDLFDLHIGPFGKFQKMLWLMTMWAMLVFGFAVYECVFTTMTPEFGYTYDHENLTHLEILNRTGSCAAPDSIVTGLNNSISLRKYVYDDSVYSTTIVTQYDLVCERAWLVATSKSILMFGFAVGVFSSGLLSDMYGRRSVFLWASLMPIVSRIVCAFSPNFIVYGMLRFITGVSVISAYTVVYTLTTEVCGRKSRLWIGGIAPVFFVIATLITVLLSYFIRDRVTLELVITLFYLPALSFFWLVPESPRWLHSKKRHDDVHSVLHKMAKWNKTQLPECMELENDVKQTEKFTSAFVKIFSSYKLLHWTLVLFLNWTSASMVFYGIALNMGKFAGDLHVNIIISALLEIPSYVLMPRIINTPLGRCGTVSVGMIFASLCLLVTVPLGEGTAVTYLCVLAKSTSVLSFVALYPCTSEIYPTPIRNIGLGSGSAMARVGSLLAPYVMLIGIRGGVALYGCLCLVSGLLILTLPDTRDRPLPQTVEDATALPSFLLNIVRKLREIFSRKRQIQHSDNATLPMCTPSSSSSSSCTPAEHSDTATLPMCTPSSSSSSSCTPAEADDVDACKV